MMMTAASIKNQNKAGASSPVNDSESDSGSDSGSDSESDFESNFKTDSLSDFKTDSLSNQATSHRKKPWQRPYTVLQRDLDNANSDAELNSETGNDAENLAEAEQVAENIYAQLKQRLARVPSLSKHSRQTLYVDLWTGQYWLGLKICTRSTTQATAKDFAVDSATTPSTNKCARTRRLTGKRQTLTNQRANSDTCTDSNTRSNKTCDRAINRVTNTLQQSGEKAHHQGSIDDKTPAEGIEKVEGTEKVEHIEKELLKPISTDTALSIASSPFGIQ